MRAAVLEDKKKIVVREVPDPKIGPRDVLVRSRACGICGTDVHIWEGEFFPTYPLVPGHELAGEIVRVPAKNCYRFEKASFSEGAFTEPLACVVFGQDRARIDIGSEVLVFGAGPIGQLHVQAARANGAASVTVIDTVESKLDLARRMGAANT